MIFPGRSHFLQAQWVSSLQQRRLDFRKVSVCLFIIISFIYMSVYLVGLDQAVFLAAGVQVWGLNKKFSKLRLSLLPFETLDSSDLFD